MRLILIRHGLTDYNLKKRYCGFKDISINKIGKTQLIKIKNKLRDFNVDKVYCSDLKRSWQSAKILFGKSNCLTIKKPNLREINFGDWEGLNFKQILTRYPSVYKKWIKNPRGVNIPGGENISHFINRIKKEFKKIAFGDNSKMRFSVVRPFLIMFRKVYPCGIRKVLYPERIDLPIPFKEGSYTFLHHKKIINDHNNKCIALVIHSGPIRVILNSCLRIKRKYFWRLNIAPESIYVLEYNARHLRPKIYKL